MAIVLGLNAKLYYGTSAGSYTEMTNVRDLSLSMETAEADVTTRASDGWRQSVATLKDASLEFEMLWDTADGGFSAMESSFNNGTAVFFRITDGDQTTSGTQGLDSEMMVVGFSRNESLEEAITVSVTAKPTVKTTGGGTAWLEVT
tara:strand:+ start:427 stop:864 length:438 start_codon:yes stop_codon:yes gene_type:complete